jgi:hypothetical protein
MKLEKDQNIDKNISVAQKTLLSYQKRIDTIKQEGENISTRAGAGETAIKDST